MLKAAVFLASFFVLGMHAFADDCRDPGGLASGYAVLGIEYKELNRMLDAMWLEIDNKPGCEADGADFIKGYRKNVIGRHIHNLNYREVQFAAVAGQTERGIALMREVIAGETVPEMVHYREAELAFLQRDRAALVAAREKLLSLPEPEGFKRYVLRMETRYPDEPQPIWPPNVDVVDRLLNCFEFPYREAYEGCEKSDQR